MAHNLFGAIRQMFQGFPATKDRWDFDAVNGIFWPRVELEYFLMNAKEESKKVVAEVLGQAMPSRSSFLMLKVPLFRNLCM